MKSKGDGHCIIHSLVSCLSSIHETSFDIDIILSSLIHECEHFEERYKSFYTADSRTFFTEMHDYVYKKRFDSLFCELVPAIMANVLNHVIVVIDVDTNSMGASRTTSVDDKSNIEVYTFFPEYHDQTTSVCTLCGTKSGILMIQRSSYHFDTCVQTINNSSPCSCVFSNISELKNDKKSASVGRPDINPESPVSLTGVLETNSKAPTGDTPELALS